MTLNLLEPISSLFKYQVRKLARKLGLPSEISERQPFPGPGFGCRIAGEITRGKAEVLREVNVVVESELRRYQPSQHFAILVNNRLEKAPTEAERIASRYLNRRVEARLLEDECIGVKGDERLIGKMVILSGGGEAATWSRLPWLDVLRLQNEITGTVKEICRVSVLLTGNPREDSGYGVIIRAVDTVDFMTAVPSKVDFKHIEEVGETVMEGYREVKFVGYEITTKPAATIELI